jgi:hypothetical protein
MTLKHAKEYAESIDSTFCRGAHITDSLKIVIPGYGALFDKFGWFSGRIVYNWSVEQKIKILEELARPEDKKKVSEFLLEQTGFDLECKNDIVFRVLRKTYPIYIYNITNGTFINGFWHITSAQALRHLADAKELLEKGELIHG